MKFRWLILFLVVVMTACTPSAETRHGASLSDDAIQETHHGTSLPNDGVRETQNLASLQAIDSLMWRQPDSALVVMQGFAGSTEADSLDVFEGHYCQVLISELLYKNYYAQSNRAELLQTVGYFDSIVGTDGADARGASLRASSSSRLRRLSGRSKTVGLVSFLLILGLRWYVFRRQRYLLKASILLHKSLSWSWVIILNKVFRAAQVGKNVVIAANSLFLSL